jgi:hypothetical protein
VNHHSSVETDLDDIKTGVILLLREELIGDLLTGWAMSGIEMARARSRLLCGTAGTCAVMTRETAKRSKLKAQSTDAQRRGGLTHISVERSVMDPEPRSQIVLPRYLSTRKGRNG